MAAIWDHRHASLGRPLVVAHRGASALAPENTTAAFKLAQGLGADGIETDVRLTSDGVPVCFHDPDLMRLARSQARVGPRSSTPA